MKGELKKLALGDLRLREKKRKSGNGVEKRGKILEMTLIDTRPAEIDTREGVGHWEGDLIIGKGHKSAILVSENTGMAVCFCHPHAPWEKGVCENTNYLIRDMLYPVDDFRELSRRDV